MNAKRKFLSTFAVLVVGFAVTASSAAATFHFTKIREVSAGTGVADSSYVETQAYFDFQNFLSGGAMLVRCNATCSSPMTFTPFADVANGHSQDTVLFADSGIGASSKDFNVDLNLDAIQAGGALCYLSEPGFNDCVSWGNFSGNSTLMASYGTTAGTPAPALGSTGMALRRSIAAGCPTMLEASDDTNNSAADFSLTTPNPRKNSVAPTEAPCPATGGGPAGNPPAPSGSTPKKKKKCKKHKHRSAQVSKKKCKKHK